MTAAKQINVINKTFCTTSTVLHYKLKKKNYLPPYCKNRTKKMMQNALKAFKTTFFKYPPY